MLFRSFWFTDCSVLSLKDITLWTFIITSTSVFGTDVYPHMPILRPHTARTWQACEYHSLEASAHWPIRPIWGFWVRFYHSGGAKFAKMWDSLPIKPVNHCAKCDAASFILGGEIRNRTNKQTNTRTVNDISTPCLSACVNNNSDWQQTVIEYDMMCGVIYRSRYRKHTEDENGMADVNKQSITQADHHQLHQHACRCSRSVYPWYCMHW